MTYRLEEAIVVCGAAVPALEGSESPVASFALGHVLGLRAEILESLDRPLEALAAYEDALERLGNDSASDVVEVAGEQFGPATSQALARALMRRAHVLQDLDRPADALAAYEDALGRFDRDGSPTDVLEIPLGHLGRAFVLAHIGQSDRAIAAFDEFVRRFAGADARLDSSIAQALNAKASILESLHRYEEAGAAYGEAVGRFADTDDVAVGTEVCQALLEKGSVLETLDRGNESVEAYDELLRRRGPLDGPEVAEIAATALLRKASVLTSTDRPAALAALDEFFDLLGAGATPGLLPVVAVGTRAKGRIACVPGSTGRGVGRRRSRGGSVRVERPTQVPVSGPVCSPRQGNCAGCNERACQGPGSVGRGPPPPRREPNARRR